MSKVKISRIFTKDFWTRKKNTEECTNVPESPIMAVEEKDGYDLLIKEKLQDVAMKHQQKEKKVESYCIRTPLDEEVFLKFKILCGRMNVTMGYVTARMIENLVKNNIDKLKFIIDDNAEV